MKYLPIAFLLLGCFSVPGSEPAMSHYSAEIVAAETEWAKDYDMCVPEDLFVVVADEPTFEDLCGGSNVPSFMGCHAIKSGTHVLVIRKTWESDARNTVTHEAMHWLAQCSGTYHNDDPKHEDPLIWGKGGILERTNEKLGLHPDSEN